MIRRATPADAQAISTLNRFVQELHAAALPWWFKPPGPDSFPPAAAAALLEKADTLVFVAENAGIAVGYAYAEVVRSPETPFRYAYEMVYLHHVAVHPDHRRRGVGRALLDAVRSSAAEQRIDLLALDVWAFNEAAREFFRWSGFKPYNERLWSR